MVGPLAQWACLWEATACKAGNVHRYADFAGLHYLDFVHSAAAIVPAFDAAPHQSVGVTVRDAVRSTRLVVQTNTNLGIVLLLAPLAKVPLFQTLREGVADVLSSLTIADSCLVYEAIRLANPGGMGRVDDQDLASTPTLPLQEVMALAEARDRIAWQYTHDFADVFGLGVPALAEGLKRWTTVEDAIVWTQLTWLSEIADSLIERKRGEAVADEVRGRACGVLASGWPSERNAFADFDAWLRRERLNPGTTADLVTASLFVALREGMMKLPLTKPWSHGKTDA